MVMDLQVLFRALLKQKNHLFLPPPYTLDLRVRNGLLEQKLSKIQDSRSFFQPKVFEGKNKKALKYVTIEPDSVKADALCKLNATVSMDDVLFIPSTETPETYQMAYHLADTVVFPTFFVPIHTSVREVYEHYVDDQWRVLFPYKLGKVPAESWNGDWGYIYRTVYALLTFLCLSLLLQYVSSAGIDAKRVFLVLFRLHAQKEDVSFQETFMGELSRVLAHLFAETYQAEHQGLYIGDFSQTLQQLKAKHEEQRKTGPFIYPSLSEDVRGRMQNARSSLYTKITRTVILPHRKNDPLVLKKFALLAVSGRESDAAWNDQEYKYLTMHGELITFDALNDSSVIIAIKKSFAYNIDSEKAYTTPTILADLTSELYQQGYEHILYLAHSPHTCTLRIPHQNGAPFKENRFFMEESVIRTMKADKPKLVLYPVFFDTFYVFSLSQRPEENSFYIRDMEELSQIIQDPSQRIIPFFYLFNGITIGDREKYRGVTAYSTFLNFYSNDIVSNEHIHLGLLYEKGPIRRDILTYLTLFHFVRNEKSGKNKLLRRDPYREIIGDGSVGRHALYSHGKNDEGVEFNMLSFLTEVRKVVNTHQL